MELVQVVPPTTEILTRDEVKSFCKITHNHEDGLIDLLNRAARISCESAARFSCMEQTWKATYRLPYRTGGYAALDASLGSTLEDPDFIADGIYLFRGPVKEIMSVKLGKDNAYVAADAANYFLEGERHLRYQNALREAVKSYTHLEVTYKSGESSLPAFLAKCGDFPMAVLITVQFAYEGDRVVRSVPESAKAILHRYWTSPLYG